MPTQQCVRGGAEELRSEAGITQEKPTLSSNTMASAKGRRNVHPLGSKKTVVSSLEVDVAFPAPDAQNGVREFPACIPHPVSDSSGISCIDRLDDNRCLNLERLSPDASSADSSCFRIPIQSKSSLPLGYGETIADDGQTRRTT